MAKLPINPQSQLVQQIDSKVQATIKAAESGVPQIANLLDKQKLDSLVSKGSGMIGSGLNMASSALGSIRDSVTTGMGNIASTVQSSVGDNAISSLTSNVGSTVGNLRNVAEGALGSVAGGGAKIGSLVGKLTGGNLAGGLANVATGISKGAGALNDLLSLRRGANLPRGGELFKQSGSGIKINPENGEDWRVRIGCDWNIFAGNPIMALLETAGGAIFPVLPNVSFSTKANYTQIDPVHNNYPFQAYKNSQIDDIQISGTVLAENSEQAKYWIAMTTFFKTMTKMFFGQGTNAGSPPPICKLNGYGASVFNNVPVVIKSFSLELDNDVNYIRCEAFGGVTWVPISSTVTVNVQPVYNRSNLRQFSLTDYAKGNLKTPGDLGYL